jgi:ABC-type multidrug transport system permease subunit
MYVSISINIQVFIFTQILSAGPQIIEELNVQLSSRSIGDVYVAGSSHIGGHKFAGIYYVFIYLYIFVYICVCTCVFICIYICVFIYMHTSIYLYMALYVCRGADCVSRWGLVRSYHEEKHW